MFLVGAISWWYSGGWKWRFRLYRERIARTLDYFSIGLLLRTIFAPFRQDSVGRVSGPLGVQFRAFLDRLISRGMGAIVRGTIVVIGGVYIICQALIGLVGLAIWAILPAVPIMGLLLWTIGWVPVWTL